MHTPAACAFLRWNMPARFVHLSSHIVVFDALMAKLNGLVDGKVELECLDELDARQLTPRTYFAN